MSKKKPSKAKLNLIAAWSRKTLEKEHWDVLEQLENFAEAYGAMLKLSGLYEAALTDIKETAERTDIPAGDALYLVSVEAEKALEHALPRKE